MSECVDDPVKINKIKEPVCSLFNSKDEKIGDIKSFLQLQDIRVQILEKNLEGYYLIFNKQVIKINKDGLLSSWPINFYDHNDIMTDKLLKIF